MQILNHKFVELFPSIILLSSVLTWGGNANDCLVISDSQKQFRSRSPVAAFQEYYEVENLYWQLSRTANMSLSIFGIGLLYGTYGFDFESILLSLWKQESVYIKSLESGTNVIPMMHVNDFSNRILQEIQTFGSQSNCRSYIPCVDNNRQSIHDLINEFSSAVNGSRASVDFMSKEKYLDLLITEDNIDEFLLWNVNLLFEESTSIDFPGICGTHGIIWKGFLDSHGLNALKFAIIGPPMSGKTDLALQLSST